MQIKLYDAQSVAEGSNPHQQRKGGLKVWFLLVLFLGFCVVGTLDYQAECATSAECSAKNKEN